jgi:hypothetical protein
MVKMREGEEKVQRTIYNAGRREEIQRKCRAKVVQPLLVFQCRCTQPWVGELVVFLAKEHHDADGVVCV